LALNLAFASETTPPAAMETIAGATKAAGTQL
jgi:hypothetical protein